MRNTEKKTMKTRPKTLDDWIKTQGLVLDKHLKFKGQVLLLPHVISEPKQSDLRRFALHLALCEAAAGGIHAKNLQLGFSGSAQTNQVLWSKHRGGHGSSGLVVP